MPEPQSSILRRFAGVNRQVESVFLGPQYLVTAKNWIPDTTYLLTKRPGTSSFIASLASTEQWTGLHWALSGSTRYLYGYRQVSAAVDDLQVSTDDGAWAAVTSGSFASSDKVGRLIQYGTNVYAGNGSDPIKRIPLGGTAVNLQSIASFTDGSAAPTITTDSGASILTGTYSYCWAIYDHTNKLWLERGQAREITVRQATDVNLSFPIPTGFATNAGALSSRYRGHLFITPVNYPIEFAHDHTAEGIQSSATIIRQVLADGTPVPMRGTDRTGNIFAVHRSRLFVAGDANNLARVYATNVLVPGLEQATFDQGNFFPSNAVITLPETVTGLGVASVSENDDPQSPLAIFTLTRTFLLFGDILDDPSARLVEVSSRIGCIGADATAQTPYGLFFIGLESVYRIPPGGGVPEDVGWPIAPAIKEIPSGLRAIAQCFFHKGFLKLAITPSGSTTNTTEYWLDLRNGGVGQVPSWWGPHTGVAPTAIATALAHSSEFDRAWAALPSATGRVVLLHQLSSYQDNGTTLVSTLITGALDHSAPFDAKVYQLVRVIGKAATATSLSVSLETDGGQTWGMDTSLQFQGAAGGVWDTALWDVDTWGASLYEEVQSWAPTTRPRGLFAIVTLTHSAAVRVDLRDFDLRYEQIVRDIRTNMGGQPAAGA